MLFPHKGLARLRYFRNIVYSLWIEKAFGKHDGGIYVEPPVYLRGGEYIFVGARFSSLARLRLECWDEYAGVRYHPTLRIGKDVHLNYGTHIGCINCVIIGDNVLIGSNVLITDHQHGSMTFLDMLLPPATRKLISKGPVVIGDGVWIGENAVVMPNVTIANGSIVGANSVVTKSFGPFSLIAGVPAKLIRQIGPEG